MDENGKSPDMMLSACSHVKELERDPIFGVWSLEHRFKDIEVIPRQPSSACTISNLEENTELLPIDTRKVSFGCDCVYKRVLVKIPSSSPNSARLSDVA